MVTNNAHLVDSGPLQLPCMIKCRHCQRRVLLARVLDRPPVLLENTPGRWFLLCGTAMELGPSVAQIAQEAGQRMFSPHACAEAVRAYQESPESRRSHALSSVAEACRQAQADRQDPKAEVTGQSDAGSSPATWLDV